MTDCLFCRFVSGEIPVKPVYEDDSVLAFNDINPQAPIHFLVIPKIHFRNLTDAAESDPGLAGSLLAAGARIAKELGISDTGYRVVLNANEDAGQTVFHLHAHFLGKRKFLWPPG